MELILEALSRCNQTFMLVPPHDKILILIHKLECADRSRGCQYHERRDHGLVHTVFRATTVVPVLMQYKQIEPVLHESTCVGIAKQGDSYTQRTTYVFLLGSTLGANERHLLLRKHPVQALVTLGTHAIKSQLKRRHIALMNKRVAASRRSAYLGLALGDKDGANFDVVNLFSICSLWHPMAGTIHTARVADLIAFAKIVDEVGHAQ